MKTLQEWIDASHSLAREKGWYEGVELPLKIGSDEYLTRVALIRSELSEALECVRDGHMDVYWQRGGKPEGFPIELADAFLRTCDLIGGQQIGRTRVTIPFYQYQPRASTPPQTAAMLEITHRTLSRDRLFDVLHDLQYVADVHGFDLYEMAKLKHEYNKTRPHRHGGKAL